MLRSTATRVEASAARQGIVLDAEQRALLTEMSRAIDSSQTARFYVHGPAGRGKTWLMTEVFNAAPFDPAAKRTVHFHTFFQELQRRFRTGATSRTAIESTVEELLDGAELFAFDELHVHDPGGASLLNRLLGELTARGIPTLITSNYPPDGLLPNPVYHHVFEPGIRIITERFAVRTLDGGSDYREQAADRPSTGFGSGSWILTTADRAGEAVSSAPTPLLPANTERTSVLRDHHALSALATRGGEIWFDFADLLETPSTVDDYLELTETFDEWVLVGVPRLSLASRAARQRFVSLIDVLVHADLKLTVHSTTDREGFGDLADPPPDLFRALSRLALLRG